MPAPDIMPRSVISALRYDPYGRVLTIRFSGGREYSYLEVEPALYDELRLARLHAALEPT
jgi:YD repeat-containing protein